MHILAMGKATTGKRLATANAPPPRPCVVVTTTTLGFCLVCFAAVAAFHAVETLGCDRVAIMDFDVHHGNGVAALVRGNDRVLIKGSCMGG